MGWLDSWAKRVKITIDKTDVTSALADFPVLIYLSASSGVNSEDLTFIFDELTADANRHKIAVTTTDGMSECYVEVEEWDDANEEAWLWVKVPAVASASDTDLYLYYDSSHADNSVHVGDPNSAVAENVWDTNFVLVSHMRDDPDSSHIRDSTTNDNDGTKKGAGEPAVTTSGQISDAQDFDGIDDKTSHVDSASLSITGSLAIELWVNLENIDKTQNLITKDRYISGSDYDRGYYLAVQTTNKLRLLVNQDAGGTTKQFKDSTNTVSAATWYHITAMFNAGDSSITFLVNGVEWVGSTTGTCTSIYDNAQPLTLGYGKYSATEYYLDGVEDEVRLHSSVRSNAWWLASYESQRDDLLDYGSEEVIKPSGAAFPRVHRMPYRPAEPKRRPLPLPRELLQTIYEYLLVKKRIREDVN